MGTAVVVLPRPNDVERARGSSVGAVVTGLGTYTGNLSAGSLTEAVRTGALRYLLHFADCTAQSDGEIGLATLLLGYNSTASLTIRASVEALVRGVVEANQRYRESTKHDLHIGALEIVELYRDSTIAAMHALQQIAASWRSDSAGLDVRLEVPQTLAEGPGIRPRLDDNRMMAYWPRLMITDADRDENECPPECFESKCPPECFQDPCECKDGETHGQAGAKQPAWLRRSTALAERIKFVHVGQRARADTVVQQRQPGLVEKLVAEQLGSKLYKEDFCRTLFHLMLPHDFKDAARHLDRIVLVVDGYTANLPWELMLAEKNPLAVTTAVVRQLASSSFRRQVRQNLAPLAYVIGNPSTDHFFETFPAKGKLPAEGLVSLPGAEREAHVVVEALLRHGYIVERAIGQSRQAIDVINPLYQKPYRIVHVAAHGEYDLRAVDGKARSGVVLSGGLFLTAAEIEQMETVPDLVFLNCCHLANVDARPVAYNKLAYSISRQLIEIGVRCVIAAGWAVDDDAAYTFAETFYQKILGRFGDAVFAARKVTYERHGASFTWGAYQAYGDPSWRLNPRDGAVGRSTGDEKFVAPEELIDRLQRIQIDINRQKEALSKTDARAAAAQLEALLKRGPLEWQKSAPVNAAVGAAYGELGGDITNRPASAINRRSHLKTKRAACPSAPSSS